MNVCDRVAALGKGLFTPSVSDDAATSLPNQFYWFGVVQLHLAEASASMLGVTVQLRIHQSHRRCVTVAR